MWNRFTGSLNPAPSIIYSSLAIHQIFILPMHFPAWTCHYEGRGKGWGVTAPGNSALPGPFSPSLGFMALQPCDLLPSLSSSSIFEVFFSFYERYQSLWLRSPEVFVWFIWPYRVSNLLINLLNLPMSSRLYLLCFCKFSENMFMMELLFMLPQKNYECTS